jgi:hypothetical protein
MINGPKRLQNYVDTSKTTKAAEWIHKILLIASIQS